MRKPKEYKAFEDLVKKVLAVPKKEIDRREAEYKKREKPRRRPSDHRS
jgi:hypothetical protein